ncbi:MAG: acyl carrier protein [Candidatus Omnitrophica bacterium]|nr:acyl carrier protein [Candidatus Omnitrophota bacterium]
MRTDNEIKPVLNEIFRDIFDDPAIQVREEMTAADVEEWDSLNHINLIMAVEKRFGIKFTTRDVGALKNVGDFIRLIQKSLS